MKVELSKMTSPVEVNSLSLEEKVAQMLVPGLWENIDAEKFVERVQPGGIWPVSFTKNDSVALRKRLQNLQELSKIPMFISTDFENGAGQFCTDGTCTEFPMLMAYGAIADLEDATRLAYESGKITAVEAGYLGISLTPSPVYDVNVVAENPICNTRSVGSDPKRVASIASAWDRGARTGVLLTNMKHFPGEGMHKLDPHLDFERMEVTKEQMETIHLQPFIAGIADGAVATMTNHAVYECYDDEYPCTLSKKILTDLLRNKLGFDGIIITDAMEMQGIVSKYGAKEACVLAINAGSDLLLAPKNYETYVEDICDEVNKGNIKIETIDKAVHRILCFKEYIGLFDQAKSNSYVLDSINIPKEERLNLAKEVAKKSITLIRNNDDIKINSNHRALLLEPAHPRYDLAWGLKFNLYSVCDGLEKEFKETKTIQFSPEPIEDEVKIICDLAKDYDIVIMSTSFRSQAGQTGLLTKNHLELLKKVVNISKKHIFVVSNPYVTAQLPFAENIICCYGPFKVSVDACIDVLCGREVAIGKLPVEIPEKLSTDDIKLIAHD